MAFAPDGLTSVGGYPGDETKGVALFGTVDKAKMTEDSSPSANWLRPARLHRQAWRSGLLFWRRHGQHSGRSTGSRSHRRRPRSTAAQPRLLRMSRRSRLAAAANYASLDTGITSRWPAYETALKAAGVTVTGYVYEGVNHGFHNDTTPRYDEAAAKLAWQRSIDFFNKYLRG